MLKILGRVLFSDALFVRNENRPNLFFFFYIVRGYKFTSAWEMPLSVKYVH